MARKPVIPGDTRETARSAVIHGLTIVTGTTKGSFSTPLRVSTKGARTLTLLIEATGAAATTAFLRRFGASRKIIIDDAGTVLTAGTPIAIVLNGDTAGGSANVGLGDEAEVVITNVSGGTLTYTAELIARR